MGRPSSIVCSDGCSFHILQASRCFHSLASRCLGTRLQCHEAYSLCTDSRLTSSPCFACGALTLDRGFRVRECCLSASSRPTTGSLVLTLCSLGCKLCLPPRASAEQHAAECACVLFEIIARRKV